jgi:hypothetical protein
MARGEKRSSARQHLKQQAFGRALRARPAVQRPERQRHLEQLMDDAATSIKDRERERGDNIIDLEELIKSRTRGESGR